MLIIVTLCQITPRCMKNKQQFRYCSIIISNIVKRFCLYGNYALAFTAISSRFYPLCWCIIRLCAAYQEYHKGLTSRPRYISNTSVIPRNYYGKSFNKFYLCMKLNGNFKSNHGLSRILNRDRKTDRSLDSELDIDVDHIGYHPHPQ